MMKPVETTPPAFFVEDCRCVELNRSMSSKTVVVPVADLRREPNHRSERVSQALYGHEVEVTESQEQFDLVRCTDGYQGWIACAHLQVEAQTVAKCVVSTRWALFGLEDGGEVVLPFGALVRKDGGDDLFGEYRTGLRMVLAVGSVDEQPARTDYNPTQVARTLLSAPYLWGGTSPYGYDCSGFVQAVFRRCGIELPRDSKDQCSCGKEVSLADSRADDLVFFPGHVALCLGERHIIHATRLRGMVVTESLDPAASDCRLDLLDKITAVRRLVP